MQHIDKAADIPVDVQGQVSTVQASQHDTQHSDEVVPTLMESEIPSTSDADDPCLNEAADEDDVEHENKKRKFPAEADFERLADESDFDRFDELVLPSLEEKTLHENIASGDEAQDGPEKEQEMTRSLVQGGEFMLMDETNVQGPDHKMIQEMHAEWAQELCELQRKFADEMASEMTDVKNDLAHVRELL